MAQRSDRLFEALDLHLAQMAWSDTELAAQFMERFIEDEHLRETTFAPEATGRDVMYGEHRSLNRAETYYVEQDMLDMVTYASLSAPSDLVLEETDLPSASGFVIFESPVMIRDSKDNHLSFAAMSWESGLLNWRHVLGDTPPEERTRMGIKTFLYTDPFDERDTHHDVLTYDIREGRRLGLPMPPFIPTMANGIPFGVEPLYVIERDAAAGWSDEHGYVIVDSAAFIFAFFKLIVQEVGVVAPHRPSRPQLRRAARLDKIPMDGMIRTVVLRRAKPKAVRNDEEREPMEWSHRWPVRGFWRTYHKGTPKEFQGWVSPHIRPNDEMLPLVLKDLVYDWRR